MASTKQKRNLKGNTQGGASQSTGAGAGAVQDLGGVQRVVTGSGPAEGQSGLQPAGSASVTEGSKPPQGYETWDAFREAVDKGTYKPPPAADPSATPPAEGQQTPPADSKNTGLPSMSDPAVQAKLAPYSTEFQKTGTLSAESKAKAAKEFGVAPEMVDLYLAGVAATATASQQPFYQEFGGETAYKEFSTWADQNLTDAEKSAYNSALDKAPEAALALAKGFKARWQSNGGGQAPRDITQSASTAQPGGDVYSSWAQVQADMGKPEYTNDPAFRAKVEAKLGRSNPTS